MEENENAHEGTPDKPDPDTDTPRNKNSRLHNQRRVDHRRSRVLLGRRWRTAWGSLEPKLGGFRGRLEAFS